MRNKIINITLAILIIFTFIQPTLAMTSVEVEEKINEIKLQAEKELEEQIEESMTKEPTEIPLEEEPVAEEPVVEELAEDQPTEEPLTEDQPTEEPSTTETPKEDPPTMETPKEEVEEEVKEVEVKEVKEVEVIESGVVFENETKTEKEPEITTTKGNQNSSEKIYSELTLSTGEKIDYSEYIPNYGRLESKQYVNDTGLEISDYAPETYSVRATNNSQRVPVIFEDKALETEVLDALRQKRYTFADEELISSGDYYKPKEETVVYEDEMIHLRYLIAQNMDITSLKGLEHATNLERISLGLNSNLTDIKELAHLTNLWDVDLHHTQVTDLTPLSSLTNLVVLDVSFIQELNSLEALRGIGLIVLKANDCKIKDLSPLSDMMDLQILIVANNEIETIQPIIGLENFVFFIVSNNRIETIEGLKVKNIIAIDVGLNYIADLTPVTNKVYEQKGTDSQTIYVNSEIPQFHVKLTDEYGNSPILSDYYPDMLEHLGNYNYRFKNPVKEAVLVYPPYQGDGGPTDIIPTWGIYITVGPEVDRSHLDQLPETGTYTIYPMIFASMALSFLAIKIRKREN